MNQGLIPKRYAKALYEVACDNGTAAKLYATMQHITAAFAAEPALADTMNNPFVDDADKAALVYTASGTDASDSSVSAMVQLLKTNHRMGMVRDIAAAYQDIYRKANKIYRVDVVSAAPLAKAEEERLKQLILKHLDGGTMEYTAQVDPDLIGGFTITVENQRLDASVKNELKQLRLKLLSDK